MVFPTSMRINRTIRAGFLLLSLILPLAGYASAMSNCDLSPSAMQPAAGATGGAHHCQHPPTAGHHHCGGDCCGVVALPAPPSRWQAPRYPAGEFSDSLSYPEPKVALDRLDRPPRSPA
jgi:hypothetical protein